MQNALDYENLPEEAILLAGRRVNPGRYRELNTGKTVLLETEDTLPASLDGRVACYARIAKTWAQIAAQGQTQGKGD